MKYLLDNDHLTILQRKAGPEFHVLSGRLNEHDRSDLAFSIISFHEQAMGAHAYINRATKPFGSVKGYGMLARVIRDFSAADVIPSDEAAAVAFDDLSTRRLRVGTMDLRIAAIALSRDLILLTRNTRDFVKVSGLRTMDWTV